MGVESSASVVAATGCISGWLLQVLERTWKVRNAIARIPAEADVRYSKYGIQSSKFGPIRHLTPIF